MNTPWYLAGYSFVLALLIAAAGCSDSPTRSDQQPAPDQSSIQTSMLSIAVIPGGSETLNVTATNADGSPDVCSASCSDEGVAIITQNGSSIEVTGVDYGETVLTITSESGKTREVPIQVYDHRVLDTGELLITYVDQFRFRWRSSGGLMDPKASFYHPGPPIGGEGYHALGTLGFSGHEEIDGDRAMMVVGQKEGSDALAYPTDYTRVWSSGDVVSFWLPVPPDGYRAMGVVVQPGSAKPPLHDVVCVREDLTLMGGVGDHFWSNVWPGDPLVCWTALPPTAGPHEFAYLDTGTFITSGSSEPPSAHPAMNVLKVELPLLAEAPTQAYVPTLSGYDTPDGETCPVLAKVMLSPCTILNDPDYSADIQWRLANSPFYRLERQVYYKLLYHNYNQTSQVQENKVGITAGVTTTESEAFRAETSVSVTAEAGVNIEWFSGKVSATVSRSLGYETQTSISELLTKTDESTVYTAPGKAAALWQKYTRLVLKRHNGTSLEPVKAWDFGIDSYVTDEYPDD